MHDSMESALALLPHGPQFRFIDRLINLERGKSGAGEYFLRREEPFLQGHFPGEPMLPGVLLVEAAAQLAGVVAQSDPEIPPLPNLKLAGIRNVKITGTARPGDTVRMEAKVTGRLDTLVQATVLAWVRDQVVLRGELILSGDAPRDPSR